MEHAFRVAPKPEVDRVLCPCAHCGNTRPRSKFDMQLHRCKYGFRRDYTVRVYHGESYRNQSAKPSHQTEQNGKKNDAVADAGGEEVSKQQGTKKKREISLVEAYVHSRLRKEDRVLWDQERILWEQKRDLQNQNSSKRPVGLSTLMPLQFKYKADLLARCRVRGYQVWTTRWAGALRRARSLCGICIGLRYA